MKRIYKKYFKTVGVIWTVCLVSFVLLYVLLLSPQMRNYKVLKAKLAEAENAYNLTVNSTSLDSLQKLKDQVEQLRIRMKDFVIDFSDTPNLTFDISQIAKEKQVASFSIKDRSSGKNSEIPNCDNISEKQVEIRFEAGFNQFAGFLNALERHRPVIFIDEFMIKRPSEGSAGNEIEMNLSVFVTKQQTEG